MKNKIKIVIADDELLFRKWLKYMLHSEEMYEVIAEADNGIEAAKIISHEQPDIAIIDYEMPARNGLEVASYVLQQNPEQKILMMTVHRDYKIVNRAKDIGIKGFLQKDSEENELLPVLREILKGNTFFLKIN